MGYSVPHSTEIFIFFPPALFFCELCASYVQMQVTQNAKCGVMDVTLKNETRKSKRCNFSVHRTSDSVYSLRGGDRWGSTHYSVDGLKESVWKGMLVSLDLLVYSIRKELKSFSPFFTK